MTKLPSTKMTKLPSQPSMSVHQLPAYSDIWILPPLINIKKPLSKLDSLWQNFLDPRMHLQIISICNTTQISDTPPSQHPISSRSRPTSETPFQWRFAGVSIVARFYVPIGLVYNATDIEQRDFWHTENKLQKVSMTRKYHNHTLQIYPLK